MAAQGSVSLAQDGTFTGLQAKLIGYASRIEDLRTPNEVLQELHAITIMSLPLLAGPDPNRLASRGRLTPREIAVLRLVSTGRRCRDVAEVLGLGDETVRSHMKKAQAKLGVRNRTHAVAEALRQNLIP